MNSEGKRQKAKMNRINVDRGKAEESAIGGFVSPLLPFGFCRRARQRITRHILPFAFHRR
jgi:hypothetical protein